MNRKHVGLILLLSFTAGLLGGAVSSRLVKTVVAEEFRLVDQRGAKKGEFSTAPGGAARIFLYDNSGKLIWSATSTPTVHPLR